MLAGALLLAVLLVTPGKPSKAAGSPPGQWPMFMNTPSREGRSELIGPQTSDVIWQRAEGTQSSPILGPDGTIYVGIDRGNFWALDPEDGSRRWVYHKCQSITASAALAADGGIALVCEGGTIRMLNADGTLRWRHRTWNYAGPPASPAVGPDGTMYVGIDVLYAIDAQGVPRWTFDTGSQIDGPPSIAGDGTIYAPSGGDLYAIDPDGSLQWRFDSGGAYGIGSSPAVSSDGTIYANTNDNTLFAIGSDGTGLWSHHTQDQVVDSPSSPAIGPDGTVYVGHGYGVVLALDPNGTVKWQYPNGSYHSSPSIGADGTVYIGDGVGTLYAFDPDGSVKWTYQEPNYIRSAPAIGAGQRLYVGSGSSFFAIGP